MAALDGAQGAVGQPRCSVPEQPNLDSPLARAALPILDRLHEQLADDPVSIMITDRNGVVLSGRCPTRG
ncbi:hypothetical protein [Streptomyces sp. F001]|uniref:hypothetical protein n=1 Tax=Streptomyces sp. F001 TaxID=1510026 RepID=UPI001F0F00CB|nr:hypothetical protein [Streptomyces sp. F001]